MLSVQFNHLMVIVNRLVGVLDESPEIVDKPDAVMFPSPVKRRIVLKNVGFRFGAETAVEPVLRTVSLTVPAGSWLCVMGPSGGGKSTLLYLLARLYKPSWGTITIDGVRLATIKMSSLRSRVSFVPQEPRIFSGTIRDNICYGVPDAEPQQIMMAAKPRSFTTSSWSFRSNTRPCWVKRGSPFPGGSASDFRWHVRC